MVIFATLFGLALCSTARVLWVWKTPPAFGDVLGLASELLVALLSALLFSRFSTTISGLFAAL